VIYSALTVVIVLLGACGVLAVGAAILISFWG
jgi:hypothetical protein